MIDMDAVAAKLYGAPTTSTTANEQTPAAITPASDVPTKPPEAAGAKPEATPASLYDVGAQLTDEQRAAAENTFGPALRAARNGLVDRAGWDADAARQSAAAFGELAYREGLPSETAHTLVEVAVAAEINPPDDATLIEWRNSAHTELRTAFGDSADLALQDARAYVRANPALYQYLDRTGLQANPYVVSVIAQRARQLRLAGKLK